MMYEKAKTEIYTPEAYITSICDVLDEIGVYHVVSYQHTKGYWKSLDEVNLYEDRD